MLDVLMQTGKNILENVQKNLVRFLRSLTAFQAAFIRVCLEGRVLVSVPCCLRHKQAWWLMGYK